MPEHLFNGVVVAVTCKRDPKDTGGVVTITTDDIGDVVMGERVTVVVERAQEATDA